MKRFSVELVVGLFVITGIVSFAYLAVRLGDLKVMADDSYPLTARFRSISGLKEGAVIEIAGVRVGQVSKIALDGGEYRAVVHLAVDGSVKLQEDAIASIRTSGIIGDKFVNITPGGSETFLEPGAEISETESAISLEELVSKYIFQKE